MGKWWHSIVSALIVAGLTLVPPLQGVVAAHPVLSTVLGFVWAVIGHILPSPLPVKQ